MILAELGILFVGILLTAFLETKIQKVPALAYYSIGFLIGILLMMIDSLRR